MQSNLPQLQHNQIGKLSHPTNKIKSHLLPSELTHPRRILRISDVMKRNLELSFHKQNIVLH